MFYRYTRELSTARYRFNTRRIYRTAPVTCDPTGAVAFVSQVCHRDLGMYLLAVKSLARYVLPNGVFVLDDGSLTEHDKLILYSHIIGLEILPVSSVKNSDCPTGGCWERLLFIADTVGTTYVIQVDSDTLTVREPIAVQRHIEENGSFTLGEWRGQEIVNAKEAADQVIDKVKSGSLHVQMLSEASLHQLALDKQLKYVRGGAGFAGFAKESFSRDVVEGFSAAMAGVLGEKKWSEWGSEQVTSNLIVANCPKAAVLPFPEYCFHRPDIDVESATLVHFIGTYRFHGGRYARLAKRVLSGLR